MNPLVYSYDIYNTVKVPYSTFFSSYLTLFFLSHLHEVLRDFMKSIRFRYLCYFRGMVYIPMAISFFLKGHVLRKTLSGKAL
jgi:hypothetical protein